MSDATTASELKLNQLGKHDVPVSELSLGSGRLLHKPGPRRFRERRELLELALDLGINFFDTADSYACGLDEAYLGKVMRERRDRIVIATKAGYHGSALAKLRFKLIRGGDRQCFEPDYLRRRLEVSLRRLKTDRVDVFYLHSPPDEVRSRGESYEVLQQLKSHGKLRLAGVSCAELTDFFDLPHAAVDVVQVPFDHHYKRLGEVRSRCRELGIGFVLRQPFSGRAIYEAQEGISASLSARDWIVSLIADYEPDSILFATSSKANLRHNAGVGED